MSIKEQVMAVGRWDVRLNEDAREAVDLLDDYSHIIVTDQYLGPNVGDTIGIDTLAAEARYVGILRERRTFGRMISIGGPGLLAWLGDENGVGEVIESKRDYLNAGAGLLMSEVLDGSTAPYGLLRGDTGGVVSIRAGTIGTLGSNKYAGNHLHQTPRQAIDYVAGWYTGEHYSTDPVQYRVNNDATIDLDVRSVLFGDTPTAVVVARSYGEEPGLDAIPASEITVRSDGETYVTRTLLMSQGIGPDAIKIGTATSTEVPPRDYYGTPVVRTVMVSEPRASSDEADSRAAYHLSRLTDGENEVEVTSKGFIIEGEVNVGEPVYLFDPLEPLFIDYTNEIRFRGNIINPAAYRVQRITRPIARGMGVYHSFRDPATGDVTVTDLTPWVVWEEPTTVLTVGAAPRQLFPNVGTIITDALVGNEGSAPSSTGSVGPDQLADSSIPNKPQNVAGVSDEIITDHLGIDWGNINITWDAVTTNTDSSAIIDLDTYTVRWKETSASVYNYVRVGDITAWNLLSLPPGTTYNISVEAVDSFQNASGYESDVSVAVGTDAGAPSQPAVPTVVEMVNALQVQHDLTKDGGGDLESDLDHFDVYIDPTSGFTPAAGNKVGEIPANNANIGLGIKVLKTFPFNDNQTRYVVVKAVDRSGNESAASTEVSATPVFLAVGANIVPGDGNFEPPVTIDLFSLDPKGSSFSLAASTSMGGTQLLQWSYTPAMTGAPHIYLSSPAPPTAGAAYHVPANPGDVFAFKYSHRLASGTANRVRSYGRFLQQDGSGSSIDPTDFGALTTPTGTVTEANDILSAAPADVAYAVLALRGVDDGNTGTIELGKVTIIKQFDAAQALAVGTITAASAIINDIDADVITTGTLNASVVAVTNINASNINTGTLDASGITVTNLSASSITTGTLSGTYITTNTLDANRIKASNLAVRLNITAGGVLAMPSTSASSRIEITGGATPSIALYSTSAYSATDSRVSFHRGSVTLGSLTVDGTGSNDLLMLQTPKAKWLYIDSGTTGTVQVIGSGRSSGEGGLGTHPTANAFGVLTRSTNDTPVSFYQNAVIGGGKTHFVVQNANSSNSTSYHMKMITRGGTDQTNYQFRMDGLAEAYGTGAAWNTPSDERLKTNFIARDVVVARSNIASLDVQEWSWEASTAGPRRVGPTAQHLKALYPQSVSTHSTSPWTSNPNDVVWDLVRTVQDLVTTVYSSLSS